VNLTTSLEQSCNVYYYDLAFKLGITKISTMMEKFGFGDYTGIDLYEESRAIMPSVEWKRTRYNKPWYTGETLSVGIGQSYWTVTPLQLSQAMSILVNQGQIKIPHFLKSTTQSSFQELKEESQEQGSIDTKTPDKEQLPTVIADIIYEEKAPIVLKDPKNWRLVLDGMHNTAQKFGATAYTAFKGSRYDAAGKTGSAQLTSIKQGEEYDAAKTSENKRDNAMFISFAPYENPEIIVAVAIENVAKGGGGTNAAPVARQIMDQYFGKRVIISTDESKHPHHDKVYGKKSVRKKR